MSLKTNCRYCCCYELSGRLTRLGSVPSILDTIGSFYPLKSLFQMAVAIATGVDSMLLVCYFAVLEARARGARQVVLMVVVCGALRILGLLGMSVITLEDHHSVSINSLTIYVLSSGVWMWLLTRYVELKDLKTHKKRVQVRNLYLLGIGGISILFYKHQVERVKYSYSLSSVLQWALVGLDIYFGSLMVEFRGMQAGVEVDSGLQLARKLGHSS